MKKSFLSLLENIRKNAQGYAQLSGSGSFYCGWYNDYDGKKLFDKNYYLI